MPSKRFDHPSLNVLTQQLNGQGGESFTDVDPVKMKRMRAALIAANARKSRVSIMMKEPKNGVIVEFPMATPRKTESLKGGSNLSLWK